MIDFVTILWWIWCALTGCIVGFFAMGQDRHKGVYLIVGNIVIITINTGIFYLINTYLV